MAALFAVVGFHAQSHDTGPVFSSSTTGSRFGVPAKFKGPTMSPAQKTCSVLDDLTLTLFALFSQHIVSYV